MINFVMATFFVVVPAAEVVARDSVGVVPRASLLHIHRPHRPKICRQMSGESTHWRQTYAVHAPACSGFTHYVSTYSFCIDVSCYLGSGIYDASALQMLQGTSQ